MKALIKRIRRLLDTRRTRGQLRRVISIVACIVVFATTYALVLPAITMEAVARCGKEAHEHTAGCYEKVLICREPEADGHHHTDDCYRIEKVLDCNMEEHTHGPECRDAEGNLICEKAEHTHGNACYREERELICGLEESEGHHHTDACYENRLVCGKEVHIHSTECYENDEPTAQDDIFAGGDSADFTENNSADSTFTDDGFSGDEFAGSEIADDEFTENEFSDGGTTFSDADQEFTEPDGFDGADEFTGGADPEDGSGSMETQGLEEGTVFEDPAYAEDGTVFEDPAYAEDSSYYEDPAADNQYDDTAYTEEINDGAVPAAAGENLEDENADPASADAETPDGTEAVNPDEAGVSAEPDGTTLNEDPVGSGEEQNPDGSAAANIEAADTEKEARSGEEAGEAGTDKTTETDAPGAEAQDSKTAQDAATEQDGTAADTEKADGAGTASDKEKTDGTDAAKSEGKETDAAEADAALKDQTGAEKDQNTDSFAAMDQLQAPADLERFLTDRTGIWYYPAVFDEDGKADTADINSESVTDWKKVEDDTVLSPEDFVRIYLAYTLPAGTLSETNHVARYTLPANLHLTPAQIEAINTHENGYYLSLEEDAQTEEDSVEENRVEENLENPADSPAEVGFAQGDQNAAEAILSEEENTTAGSDAKHTGRQAYLGAEAVEGSRTPGQSLNDQKEEYISAVVKAEEIYDEDGNLLGQELVFTFLPYTVEKNENVYEDTAASDSVEDAEPSDELIREGKTVNGFLTIDFATGQIDFADTETENIKTAEITFAHENETEGIGLIRESLTMNTSADFRKSQEIRSDQDSEEKAGSDKTEEKTSDDKTADGENNTSDEKDVGKEENKENTENESGDSSDKDTEHKEGADLPADAMPARTFEDFITLETARPASVGETGTIAEAAGTLSAESEVRVRVEADEGTFPAGTTMVLSAVESKDMDAVAKAVENAVAANADTENKANSGNAKSPQTCGFQAVDISFRDADGNEIEPAKPVRVVMTSSLIKEAAQNDTISAPVVVHVDNKGNGEQIDLLDPEKIEAAKGRTEEELIKEVEAVGEIEKNTRAEDKAEGEDKSEAESDKVSTEDSVGYETDRFSIYAIVYTVDFHWEVDGRMYEFSLPGGGFISLSELIEVLGVAKTGENGDVHLAGEVPGIDNQGENGGNQGENGAENAENTGYSGVELPGEVPGINTQDATALTLDGVVVSEATREFVADVESVVFSSPELVWVGKIEEESTVGGIKESQGLECVYSAELTEEQIEEINETVVESGDWALISVQPFESTESLTVTMRTGEVFEIRVTDYQISTNVLTADGKTYKITVTFDDDAEIPAGTELVAEEIEPGTDEYIQYLGQTWTEVNKEYLERLVSKDPGEYCDIPQLSIDQARFFNITLMLGDQEIEPKAPVHVEISYVDGLGIEGIEERIAGVSHFKGDEGENEAIRSIESEEQEQPEVLEVEEGHIEVHFNDGTVELIEGVETSTDESGRITVYRYEQDGFSVVGTYIGHETRDAVMRVPQVRLTAGEGDGTLATPDPQKHLEPNKNNGVEDGTYTLSLSVTGDRNNSTKVEAKKSNVLFIMDRSSSMNRYVRYLGTIDTASTSYYGSTDNGRTVFPVFYNSGKWQYQQRVGWDYQWVDYNAEQYGFYMDVARLPEEQQALKDLFGQLLEKNTINDTNSDSDNVEIKVISFASKAGNNQGWSGTESGWVSGTSSTTLNNAVDKSSTDSGTNWEEALRYAQSVINAKKTSDGDDEDYYIVFLTDGAPTATTAHQTYYYGTEGHSATDLDSNGRPRNSCEPAYQDATTVARALVDAGCKLYNIFTYGTNDDYKYLVRLTNYAYRESDYIYDDVHDNVEPADYFPNSAAAQKYFTNATDTETLVQAFQNIFSEISVTQAHVQVKITDGLRQDAMKFNITDGSPTSATYTVTQKGSTTPLYTVTATMPKDAEEPVVTFKFKVNGTDVTYSTESETDSTKVKKHTKAPVEGEPLASYDAGEYYYVTLPDGTEYKMALATVDNTGELTWDLQPVGMLMDDCTYKAEFIVWPNQDAYDYVSALNNGLTTIADSNGDTVTVEWDPDVFEGDAHKVTDSKGKVYYKDGCTKYPSIVYYPDPNKEDDPENHIYYGTFAVLTNTDQYLDYSIVTTEDGEVTSVEPQPQIPMDLPDPMPLEDTGTFVLKKWIVDRDAGVLAQYLYDQDGNPKKFQIQFDIYQGEVTDDSDPYTSVKIGWDENAGTNGQGAYVWEGPFVNAEYGDHTYTIGTHWKADFDISAGLLLSDGRMDELKLEKSIYPSASFGGVTYYILEPGHDYTIKENGDKIGYEFDFNSPVYHPMLVDGVMKDVDITKDGDNYSISGIAPTPLTTLGLKIENNLRAYINLNKVVLDKDGNLWLGDKTKFEYTVDLHSPIKLEGSSIPWYGVNSLFYHDSDFNYYQADPIYEGEDQVPGVLTLKTESGHECQATCDGTFNPDIYGPTEITYTDEDGEEKTIQLFGNMMSADANQQDIHVTIKINQDERLNIANIPAESTYTITESQAAAYALVGISPDDSLISQRKISGDIVANADNNITFTNKVIAGSLNITKAVQVDGQSATTSYADGEYFFTITDSDGNPAQGRVNGEWIEDGKVSITITNGVSSTITVSDIPIGEYTITEEVPENGATLVAFTVSGQSKTVENGVVVEEDDKKITITANGTSATSYTNNITTTQLEVKKVWTDDGQPGIDHTGQDIYYEIYRIPYVMVDDEENPGQKVRVPYSTQEKVDASSVPAMEGFTGILRYSQNDLSCWKEVVIKLPKTGVVWDEDKEELVYLTYDYYVTEETAVNGYRSIVERDEANGDNYSFIIKNEPLGPTDQNTSLDVKKEWKNADGTNDTGLHKNDEISLSVTQKKYEAKVAIGTGDQAVEKMLYPITIILNDKNGDNSTRVDHTYVVYVPKGSTFTLEPHEPIQSSTNAREHTVAAHGTGFTVIPRQQEPQTQQYSNKDYLFYYPGVSFTFENVDSAKEIKLELHAGNDKWMDLYDLYHYDDNPGTENYNQWTCQMICSDRIIWNLDEMLTNVLNGTNGAVTTSNPDTTILSYTMSLSADSDNGLPTVITKGDNALGYGVGSAENIWEGSITNLPLYDYRDEGEDDEGSSYIYTYEVTEAAVGSDTVNITADKPEGWNGQTTDYLVKWDQDTQTGLWTLTNQKKPPIEVTIYKVDKNNIPDSSTLLKGAEFKLVKKKLVKMNDDEGVSRWSWLTDTSWGTQGESAVVSDNQQNPGTFSFGNLNAGYYEIVETKYPTGYIQANENPVFQVKYNSGSVEPEVLLVYSSGDNIGQAISENTTDMVKVDNKAIIVGNEPGAALPNTGGPGTNLIYLLGMILTAVGCCGIVMRRKRRAV